MCTFKEASEAMAVVAFDYFNPCIMIVFLQEA